MTAFAFSIRPNIHVIWQQRPLSLFMRADQSSVDLQLHEDEFVATASFAECVSVVRERRLVVLTGLPVCGASSWGRALLRLWQGDGYTPLVLHRHHDWRCHVGGDRQQVVLLDNVLGQLSLKEGELHKWAPAFPSMLRYAQMAKCVLVLVISSHVLQEIRAKGLYADFFSQVPVVDLNTASRFSDDEKRRILGVNARKTSTAVSDGQVDEIFASDQSGAAFPWCAKHCFHHKLDDGGLDLSVFSSPHEAYLPFMAAMLSHKESGRALAAMLLSGVMCEQFNVSRLPTWQRKLTVLGFTSKECQEAQTLRQYHAGSLFSKSHSGFASRPFYDACGMALASRPELLPHLLSVCDAQFLLQRVKTGEASSTSSNAIVVSKPSPAYDCLLKRVFQDLVAGNFLHVCQHDALQNPRFLADLRQECLQMKRTRLATVLSVRDKLHRDYLLYWTFFCARSRLTRWCVDLMQEVKVDKKVVRNVLQRGLFAAALCGDGVSCKRVRMYRWALSELAAGARPNPDTTLRLALPRREDCHHPDLARRVERARGRCQSHNVLYLGDPTLPVPYLMGTLCANTLRLTLPLKASYPMLRLLADRHVDETDEAGDTLLHVAAAVGSLETVQLALKSGASMLAENKRGLKPADLCRRRRRGREAGSGRRLRWLPRWPTPRAASTELLHAACMDGDRLTVSIRLCYDCTLRDSKGRKRTTPLITAARAGHTDTALLLLQLGASVNAADGQGCTPLYSAAAGGHSDVVGLLLDWGACHRTPTRSGATPLHGACFYNHLDAAKVLLERGANVNVQNKKGVTPLYLACFSSSSNMVDLLLSKHADMEVKTDEGATALHVVSEMEDTGVMERLLQSGADVNTARKGRFVPLHSACHFSHRRHVTCLLRAGANVTATDHMGFTALHHVCINGDLDIATTLIAHGANVNARTPCKVTPLYLACCNGHVDIAQYLLACKADATVSSFFLKKPADIARRKGHADIVKLFEAEGQQ